MSNEQQRELLRVNERLYAIVGRLDVSDLALPDQHALEEELSDLRRERFELESQLGDEVVGLSGYYGGPG